MEALGQVESESFNEAEVKTRKSEITVEVQQAIFRNLRGKTGNTLRITH